MNAPSRLRTVVSTLVVLALVLAVGLWFFLRDQREVLRLSAVFPTTIGVYTGSDVRILGVRVGSIESIVPNGTTVKVTMAVDQGVRVAADSTAVAISPSLVSDRYIQLTPAKRGAATIAPDTTIPVERTATPVELDEMYASLQEITTALGPQGANSAGALSNLLTTAAKNLDGNGAEINTTITDFGAAAKTLDSSQGDLFGTVTNLKSFNDTLVKNDAGITTVNSQLASVSGYLAQDRQDFAAAVAQLSQALAQVQGFIKDNRGAITADVQGLQSTAETLKKQQAALQQITAVLPADLQNFLDAYDPSTGTLTSRGNLNELGVWGGAGTTATKAPASGASTTAPASGAATTAPASGASANGSGLPMFLPAVTGAGS